MLPAKNNKIWREMILHPSNFPYQSFSLKLKLDNLRQKVKSEFIQIDEAVEELYAFCHKNEQIIKSDLEHIFNH
jgi:hypothetical protein